VRFREVRVRCGSQQTGAEPCQMLIAKAMLQNVGTNPGTLIEFGSSDKSVGKFWLR
jgi:hypothetical protein